MIPVGNKIRKIRELKNLTPKDMGDRLGLTPQGYTKIENATSGISVERLEEIAEIFEMKPEDIMGFDEKVVFNFINSQNSGNHNTYNQFPAEMKQLYEDKLKLQAEMIEMLKERLKAYEGK